jgi:hypothetical protein
MPRLPRASRNTTKQHSNYIIRRQKAAVRGLCHRGCTLPVVFSHQYILCLPALFAPANSELRITNKGSPRDDYIYSGTGIARPQFVIRHL